MRYIDGQNKRPNKTTKFKGVVKSPRGGRYQARLVLKHPKKGVITYYIGTFDTPKEAYEVRKKWIESLI
jgi:hypothetical protein